MYKKNIEKSLIKRVENLNKKMTQSKLLELSELLGNTKKMLFKNFISGIFKGIGIGIGFSLLTAVLIYCLQKIVKLNIPIIGDYISDIIDIVKSK